LSPPFYLASFLPAAVADHLFTSFQADGAMSVRHCQPTYSFEDGKAAINRRHKSPVLRDNQEENSPVKVATAIMEQSG
jgi:hypothetical protein